MKPTLRRLADLAEEERDRLMRRSLDSIFDPELWASVRSLYEDVAAAGDGALCAALERFDGVDATPGDLRVSDAELDGAGAQLAPELRDALDSMIAALRSYNERVLRDVDWSEEIAPGVVVGERSRPIASAAIYVPCGKGSFPSVMAHLGVPAAVAGVPQVVVLCPPLRATGRVDPAYLYIAAQLGLREVWRVNGPSGIAAAVLGTASIPRVRKVVGPGKPGGDRGAAAGRRARRGDEHAAGPEREPDHRRRLGRSRAAGARPPDRGRARLRLGRDAADLERGAGRRGRRRPSSRGSRRCRRRQREHAAAALSDLGGILICRGRGRGLRVRQRVRGRAPADRHGRPRGHADAHRLRSRDPDRPAHADGRGQLHDRRAQHAALGRLCGRLERRHRAHLPGHELDRAS